VSELIRKTLILSIESGSMCKQSGSLNNIAGKERYLSLSSSPSQKKQGTWKHYEINNNSTKRLITTLRTLIIPCQFMNRKIIIPLEG